MNPTRAVNLGLVLLLVACARESGSAPAAPPPSSCPAAWTAPPAIDPSLVPASSLRVLAHVSASGTQDYQCASSTADGGGAGVSWTFQGPDAALVDCNGAPFGHHSASNGAGTPPKWESADGSFVVAKKIASSPSKEPNAVPWLLLQVTRGSGSGALGTTAYVQRTRTAGGVAPSTGCDDAHVGAVAKVPYSAEYWFLGP